MFQMILTLTGFRIRKKHQQMKKHRKNTKDEEAPDEEAPTEEAPTDENLYRETDETLTKKQKKRKVMMSEDYLVASLEWQVETYVCSVA